MIIITMFENEERRSTNKISPLKHDVGIYHLRHARSES